MTRFFFNQAYHESRGRLYAIGLRAGEGGCDPGQQGGSGFCRAIALVRNWRSRH